MTDSTESFDPVAALDDLLAEVGLSASSSGGRVSFAGTDPIVAARHRLGACIGIPIMAGAVGAAALWRLRGGHGQDLHLDLRQAIHGINPDAFWHPTVAGEPAPRPLTLKNPFLLEPYPTRDGRHVMASGVYPHQVVDWCRFLDVPQDRARVATAFAARDSHEIEDEANSIGLPATVIRTPREWRQHPQGIALAGQPVIGLQRIGDAPARRFKPSARPFDGVRVLSFTHAIAGPAVGRTLAEQGADVLCATIPDEFEHDFIYDDANIGSRSAYLDVTTDVGLDRAYDLIETADVVVNNHRTGKLEKLGLDPHQLARRRPGIICVSITAYGSTGPWSERGGFDMNGSAASGLMTLEGSLAAPQLPPTGMINDFVTGYLGAAGVAAALVKQATDGGSWLVTVSLTRSAMWYQSLGLVDPSQAGSDDEHSLREPVAVEAPTPLGDIRRLAPPVTFSTTTPRWTHPVLVPRGSSRPTWLS